MEHRLKIKQPYFEDIRMRRKNFELRYNDRDYRVGDVLVLEEYDDTSICTGYSGQVERRTVTYVLKEHPQFGLEVGYCILGLA